MGIGLAAVWAALGRSTLYPVGPRRRPDHHPTCVGHARPGERDPSLQRHSGPGGTPVHARPASSQAAGGRRSEPGQTFSTAPSGTIPTVTERHNEITWWTMLQEAA